MTAWSGGLRGGAARKSRKACRISACVFNDRGPAQGGELPDERAAESHDHTLALSIRPDKPIDIPLKAFDSTDT